MQRSRQSGKQKRYALHCVTTEHHSAAVAAALQRFKTMLKEERRGMHLIGRFADM